MTMHLGTALLLLQLVLVLVAEVGFVVTSAMTLRGGEGTAGAAETTGDVVQERGVKDADDLKGANEIIEKIEQTIREQLGRRGDNHIIHHTSSVESPTDPTGSLSAGHLKSAEKKASGRSKHLKPTTSFSPPADTNIHRSPNVHAPKYMLDLYDKFSTDKYSHPMANIVRSFMNVDKEEEPAAAAAETGAAAAGVVLSNSSRVHRLMFNVTSIGREEEIYLGELRLFTLVEADRQLYDGINRRVTVNEVIPTGDGSSSGAPSTTDDGNRRRLELIDSKVIYGRHSGWETITFTEAVRRWIKQRPQGDMHILEVRIETVGRLKDEPSSSSRGSSSSIRDASALPPPPVVDINWRPNNENEPLLLVYSNDRRRPHVHETNELNEIVEHEADVVGLNAPLPPPNGQDNIDYVYYDEEVVYEYDDDVTAAESRRKKREAVDSISSSTRMRKRTDRTSRVAREVESHHRWDHDDPPSPADEGIADYPMEIARRLRMKNETRSAEEGDEDEDDDDALENEESSNFRSGIRTNEGRRSEGRKRVRRSGKRRLRRNSCHRVPMYVDFEDINWHNWILRPFGYQAYECQGRCNFPLDDHLTPTKHAIIQTMLNSLYPKKATQTCCVPTKLEPISILYIDDQGIVTYKYKYEGMVVTECGCR